ncbi:MAG: DUF2203 domain-containing protein [Moorea sp. SIO2B7]|nr:DUF2203 domain-containing protein [Moorena sp. SIO2B7]
MMPPEDTSQPDIDDAEFVQALEEVERSLIALKERYAQVKQNQQRKLELQQRVSELKQQQKQKQRDHPIKTELRHIQQELEQIELNLESSLFRWSQLQEPFWQAVRFGGIGVVVGWILKSCAG